MLAAASAIFPSPLDKRTFRTFNIPKNIFSVHVHPFELSSLANENIFLTGRQKRNLFSNGPGREKRKMFSNRPEQKKRKTNDIAGRS